MMALSAIQAMMMLTMALLFSSFLSLLPLHLFISSLSIFSDYELWPTQLTQNKR